MFKFGGVLSLDSAKKFWNLDNLPSLANITEKNLDQIEWIFYY